jgi:1-acyl-sn-glycerol-3-phosphate acyltransferase
VWLRAAGARVVAHGLGNVEPAATYVVVSNHQSNLDPMAHLQALPLSLRILAIRELFQVPLLGRAMRTVGMIEINRESLDFCCRPWHLPGLATGGTRNP